MASGEPARIRSLENVSHVFWVRVCFEVTSKGVRITSTLSSGRRSLEVKLKMIAAASGSAYILNSARGVWLPGTLMAPPMIMIFFARAKVVASSDTARARLVHGPIAMMVIVFESFSRS